MIRLSELSQECPVPNTGFGYSGAPGYFTLTGDMTPAAIRDSSEVARVLKRL